jgi:hypothetical protein
VGVAGGPSRRRRDLGVPAHQQRGQLAPTQEMNGIHWIGGEACVNVNVGVGVGVGVCVGVGVGVGREVRAEHV